MDRVVMEFAKQDEVGLPDPVEQCAGREGLPIGWLENGDRIWEHEWHGASRGGSCAGGEREEERCEAREGAHGLPVERGGFRSDRGKVQYIPMTHWRWLLAAAATGFLSSFVFSTVLGWPRDAFVLGWGASGLGLVSAWAWFERVDFRVQVRRHWLAGAVVGALFGLALMRQVFSQPESARPAGPALVGALLWDGVVYGTVDALLLSVLPVLLVYGSRPASGLRQPTARLRWGLAALMASALMAACYHLGFAEFRGPALAAPVLGNLLMTLGYLLSGSPLAPIVAHVMMHQAAVLHGMASTAQLPPHY